MEERSKENAHRIAGTLERYAADPRKVQQLAAILNYEPERLQKDMACLLDYLLEIEEITLEAPKSP